VRFTKLRLQGFKSFVEPAELVIAEGLTGVVGPNGCGKSNLLEALRWVMGETRARVMRGEGMDDVIFAGTASRAARNAASVSLVIETEPGTAPPPVREAREVEVSRRIARDLGSSYALNGRTVRARDVQMLFADASTGAASPSLVRQGQIGELIAARPVARRRVLEEAAGIAGLYQRRHEAELKLKGTEENLARVQDLLDGLEGQLKALSRQAAQARRYRELSEALRRAEALILHLRWREAAARAAEAAEALDGATRAAARAEAQAGESRRAREGAEASLAPAREEQSVAAAVVQRLSMEREGQSREIARAEEEARALRDRAAQLSADLERERALGGEAGSALARLAEEETRLREAQEGHEDRLAAAEAAERDAAGRLSDAEGALERAGEAVAHLAAERRAAETRRDETARAARDAAAEAGRLSAEAERTAGAADEAAHRAATAREAASEAERAARTAEATLAAAEQEHAAARQAEAAARTVRSEAESAEKTLAAEVATLERLLAPDADAAGGLIDRLRVAPGYEAALGAALGDDLRAPPADAPGASGWAAPGDKPAVGAPLPAEAEPLAPHVTGEARLARRLAQVGVVAAEAGEALQARLAPGQRLVSREGDLWRWDGFRRRAADAPAAGAAARRLEQRNRLEALSAEQADAEAARAAAVAAHSEAGARLETASGAEAAARRAAKAAAAREGESARALSRAEADAELLRAKRESTAERADAQARAAGEAGQAAEEAEAALATLGDGAEAEAALSAARETAAGARRETMAARARREDLRREAAGREKRLGAIRRDARAWREREATAGARIADLERRLAEAETARDRAAAAPGELAARRDRLDAELAKAEARAAAAAAALQSAEAAAREAEATERRAERAASEAREARGRAEAGRDAAEARAGEAAEAIRAELGLEPEALAAETDAPGDPAAVEVEAQTLRRQRDALGAVNLRAEEDARGIGAERDALAAEKEDLQAALAKLRSGIRTLNREGRERLIDAFERVNARFGELFRHLFGGGEARLIMVDSEDPLEAGLEILCQPPGKKLSTLSLLSGGEQTLTALSLIFAVFLCNPAPICVLDEVDAPLDDANVMRFCALLDEMVRQTDTRFLVITHHAITMSRMDRLFGVTMIEQGVSRLVSVDLTRAAEMAES
jgi:chromosome segregation protein